MTATYSLGFDIIHEIKQGFDITREINQLIMSEKCYRLPIAPVSLDWALLFGIDVLIFNLKCNNGIFFYKSYVILRICTNEPFKILLAPQLGKIKIPYSL